MNDLTNAEKVGGLSMVENLAREARHYAEQTSFNMLQLGRVLTEAKELVPHGEWEKWIRENADMDIRGAQYFMKCYEVYGLDPEMAKLGQSKLRSMLALTDGQREKLLTENDVQNMSVRKLKDEVRKAREEEQEKAREAVAAEKVNAAKMAESAARRAEKETREKLEEEIEALRAERAEYAAKAKELQERAELAESQVKDATEAAISAGRDVSAKSAELEAERRRILQELEDKDEVIREMQEQYDQISKSYLDAQSAIAKGDAERSTADILSADAVSEAVRMFIGQVGRVPYMHGTFATMDDIQLEEYRANVLQVKEWAEKSLKAMETVVTEGGVY